MEVLTALGLATNVVQFVDFASKIVSQAVKIYRAQGTQDESSEHLTPVDLLTLSYADEPNPEFSGLIESKPQESREIAFTEVGYLHRTVKDYFEREDIWANLIAATDDTFNPYLRLCTAYIINLKIRDQQIFAGDTNVAEFWAIVSYTIKYATRADPGCMKGYQPKLLDELERTATHLADLKDENGQTWLEECASESMFPVEHRSVSRALNTTGTAYHSLGAPDPNRTSFLHLAIQCQLTDYIRYVLSAEGAPRYDTVTLSRALIIAFAHGELFDFGSANSMNRNFILYKGRDPDLIGFLLTHGADPNMKIPNTTIRPSSLAGSYTPWETFLSTWTGAGFQRIGKAFLEHGADPSLVGRNIPELYDFSRKMGRRSRQKEQMPKQPNACEHGSKAQKQEKLRWWNRWKRREESERTATETIYKDTWRSGDRVGVSVVLLSPL